MLNTKMRHELIGYKQINDYISGGKGIVTLLSDSGVYHTYKFQTSKDSEADSSITFIKALVGRNEWVHIGVYKNGKFRLTKRSKYQIDSPVVKGAAFILKMLTRPDFMDNRMRLFHEGICSVCGRPLTNPDSLESGIGPVCRGR